MSIGVGIRRAASSAPKTTTSTTTKIAAPGGTTIIRTETSNASSAPKSEKAFDEALSFVSKTTTDLLKVAEVAAKPANVTKIAAPGGTTIIRTETSNASSAPKSEKGFDEALSLASKTTTDLLKVADVAAKPIMSPSKLSPLGEQQEKAKAAQTTKIAAPGGTTIIRTETSNASSAPKSEKAFDEALSFVSKTTTDLLKVTEVAAKPTNVTNIQPLTSESESLKSFMEAVSTAKSTLEPVKTIADKTAEQMLNLRDISNNTNIIEILNKEKEVPKEMSQKGTIILGSNLGNYEAGTRLSESDYAAAIYKSDPIARVEMQAAGVKVDITKAAQTPMINPEIHLKTENLADTAKSPTTVLERLNNSLTEKRENGTNIPYFILFLVIIYFFMFMR